jgi:hypothetical protein
LFERSREEFERDQEKLMSLSDTLHPTNIQTNLKVALMEAEEILHLGNKMLYHILVDNIAKILPCDKTFEFWLE